MIITEDGLITENQNLPQLENTTETQEENTQDEIFNLKNNEVDENISLNNVTQNSNSNSNVFIDSTQIDSDNSNNDVETNCLALTVRKDYNLSIVKNGFFTTLRVSWKVAVSTFILSLLKFLF